MKKYNKFKCAEKVAKAIKEALICGGEENLDNFECLMEEKYYCPSRCHQILEDKILEEKENFCPFCEKYLGPVLYGR